jgi:hypothetical protein
MLVSVISFPFEHTRILEGKREPVLSALLPSRVISYPFEHTRILEGKREPVLSAILPSLLHEASAK